MITAPSPSAPSALSGVTTAQTASTTGALSSDFDTFLQMLTAQMRNQDPLNPLDSTEFASQLATFSSVEQQVVTNDLLSSMVNLLGAGGLGDMADWVGQAVRADRPAYFDGSPVRLSVTTAPVAEESYLEVYDESDTLVQRLALPSGQSTFEWAGVDDSGAPLPAGQYSFVVDNLFQGESIGLTPVSSYHEVIEARIENGALVLGLNGGGSVDVEEITGVRALS
ncbi:flagellar hook capping FlgD N-terminal domain-containing protein [Marinovum sp.]|uniref:flagellar hook capping FlgD N-terminal domain-containing protein n=1 Tax=Marinovum sp. TaxID=2024839 RepID=UPI002B27A9CF|nr:flagellar hook capping FlgD N-terminal domain-containing protein [Marinovum sp.]